MKTQKHFLHLPALLLTIILYCWLPTPSQAADQAVYIDIGKAKAKRSLVALAPFKYLGAQAPPATLAAGQELYATVKRDLDFSSYFLLQNPEGFLENSNLVDLKPRSATPAGFDFEKWRSIKSEFLIKCGFNVINRDDLQLDCYVYFVTNEKLIMGRSYTGKLSALDQIAHKFADDLLQALTGQRGIFNTKIVVSRNKGRQSNKEIYILNWDGSNPQKITTHNSVAISPTWSPDGKKIAYSAFAYHPKAKIRNADLFLFEVATGKRWLLSHEKGMNSGADFMPDGKSLLMTLSKNGSPDIYQLQIDNKRLRRLTFGPSTALNVEPRVAPNGQDIVFSSTRGGRPMLYLMNLMNLTPKLIIKAGWYNASPDWSPDGQRIVFAGLDKNPGKGRGHFDIFIQDKTGFNLERLTSAKRTDGSWANNENPSFSPDGRHIVFTSDRRGHNQLYVIDVDGNNERPITNDQYHYYQPRWSPYLN